MKSTKHKRSGWLELELSLVWTLKNWSICEIQNVLEAGRIVSWKPEPDVVYFCFCSSEQTRIYLGANKRKAWSANIHRTKNFAKFQSSSRRFFLSKRHDFGYQLWKISDKVKHELSDNWDNNRFISTRFQRTRQKGLKLLNQQNVPNVISKLISNASKSPNRFNPAYEWNYRLFVRDSLF